MSITTKAFRFALTAAALCAAGNTADAKPRRVVILDFDGPRTLADTGRTAVVNVLGEQYDVVATKRWVDSKSKAARTNRGPQMWSKASKSSGVDAVVEGYVQDEGRSKVLTVIITDASNGSELDQLDIKLGSKGVTPEIRRQLRDGMEERLEYIEPLNLGNPDRLPNLNSGNEVKPRDMIGAKKKPVVDGEDETTTPKSSRRSKHVKDDGGDEPAETPAPRSKKDRESAEDQETTEKKPTKVATLEPKETKETKYQQETDNVVKLFVPEEAEIVAGPKAFHIPRATSRFRIGGGATYGSRSLTIGADNPDGVTQYSGIPNKGLEVNAAFYPFPTQKVDGVLSGIGFSFGINHAIGSVVTFADEDGTVGDYEINQSAWNAAIHYRQPLGKTFAIDGEVGYGQSNYVLVDAPATFEVPDTAYTYVHAGVHVDLNVTDHASIGFGGKYLYMLGTGDLSSVDWYGPGRSSGIQLDANFVIPLPSNLYARGELSYTRIQTEFDGVGQITEEEGVSDATDATITAGVNIGIHF
jgi:hypothetical protein